jgi:DNA double-strand break repair and V(D)J recombination protein XRCC4
MASSWVLKFPRSDDDQSHVLIHVSHKGGRADLDLTLLGTESETVYKTKRACILLVGKMIDFSQSISYAGYISRLANRFVVRHKKAKDLRNSKYAGSDEEWEAILRYALLSKQDIGISPELRKGLDTVAAISGREDNRTLTLTFRNHIDQITQKLGSIELKQSEEEIQLFDWAASAVDQQKLLQEEVSTLRGRSEADQAAITALQAQLADLVRAKQEHEEQLISKFALLLNEKKLKIRNQQRILSTAKIDDQKLAQLKLTLDGTESEPTRKKRRAERVAEDSDQGKEESDGFETMEVDPMPNALGDARSSRETTPETETETEDEGSTGWPAISTSAAESQMSKPNKAESDALPPPRSLPFVKKGAQKDDDVTKAKSPEPALGSDEETASEDDEL